jgi:hypothetical protein
LSSKKTVTKIIQPGLFDQLDKIDPHLSKVLTQNEADLVSDSKQFQEYHSEATIVKDGLFNFMNYFLLQFFTYGYGLTVETVNSSEAANLIMGLRPSGDRPRPENMISAYLDYYANFVGDLGGAGYELPGTRTTLKAAYCSTLNLVLEAFVKEGKGLFDNFDEIQAKACAWIGRIKSNCQRFS